MQRRSVKFHMNNKVNQSRSSPIILLAFMELFGIYLETLFIILARYVCLLVLVHFFLIYYVHFILFVSIINYCIIQVSLIARTRSPSVFFGNGGTLYSKYCA